ncbi:hypothetical protein LGM65_17720 [Burkholderia anthina]|uniref:hypothetical protein n=1 Tax=Burkholderia anthina TaxID=179879 RepID=UPI001CF1FFAC|nr:hypothetical protein [Burkholderia anthina]MCA8092706.1 hypothetical protein [Burkholderia anthina]
MSSFWQASQEVEELLAKEGQQALTKMPSQGPANLSRIRLDTSIGMAFPNLVVFFVILTTAVTLNAHPIKALFWSAVINGVTSVPIMALMMLMASNPKVMGTFVTPVLLRWVGWLSTGVMGAAVIAIFVLI